MTKLDNVDIMTRIELRAN